MLLSEYVIQTMGIQKKGMHLLVLNLLLSITIGRSKNDASEVKILSFLICNSNG